MESIWVKENKLRLTQQQYIALVIALVMKTCFKSKGKKKSFKNYFRSMLTTVYRLGTNNNFGVHVKLCHKINTYFTCDMLLSKIQQLHQLSSKGSCKIHLKYKGSSTQTDPVFFVLQKQQLRLNIT